MYYISLFQQPANLIREKKSSLFCVTRAMLRSNHHQRRLGRDDESRVEPEGCSSADGMRRLIHESLSEVSPPYLGAPAGRGHRSSRAPTTLHSLPATALVLGTEGLVFFLGGATSASDFLCHAELPGFLTE